MKKEIDLCDYCMKPIDQSEGVTIEIHDANIRYRGEKHNIVTIDQWFESLCFCNTIHMATFITKLCKTYFPEVYKEYQ